MASGIVNTYSKVTTKTYFLTPAVNSTVATVSSNVFRKYIEEDISADIASFGSPIGISAYGRAGVPVPACIASNKIRSVQYQEFDGDITIVVIFAK